jgi:hypothetical protein
MPLLSVDELRDRVTRLARIERPSASAGEREAAEQIAAELRELGAAVRIEEEDVHGTFWWPLGVATTIALAAGLTRSRWRAAVAAATATAAVVDDLRYGPRRLRGLLPRRTTSNVVAEIGPREADRTVLLTAHHDAAHSGLVFHPELFRSLARRFPELVKLTNTTPPTMWPAVAGPALVALGALARRRGVRRLGSALAGGFALAMADIGLRGVVPGANDNLSGVAVLLSVATALRDEPLDGVRVVLLSTGSEESNQEGMVAFGRRHFKSLDPERTHVVCVDTVGSPHLLLLEGEGMLGIRDYPAEFKQLVRDCADRLGVFLWPGLRFRNATDGLIALRARYPTVMIGSVDRHRVPTDYHWPTDTPENVNYATVADAAQVCHAVIRRLAGLEPDAAGGDGRPERQSTPSTSRT